MALYYLLLRFWLHLGDSEFVVRSLSVLMGVLTVPAIYALGELLSGRKVALIAAGLLALNSFHVAYSQDARGYSLVVLAVTLSEFFFLKALRDGSRRYWVFYILTSALSVYCHFFAVLVLVAQWTSVVFLPLVTVPWKRLGAATFIIGMLLAPLGLFVLTRNIGQLAWIPRPALRDIFDLFCSFAGGGRLLLLIYSVPCLAAVVLFFRTVGHSGRSLESFRCGFLLSWLFVPTSIVLATSFWMPIFVDRYLLICVPPVVLLAAIGLSAVRSSWVLAVALCAIAALSLRQLPWYGRHVKGDDWRGATSYVLSNAAPGDGILFFSSYGRLGFDYYAKRLDPGPHPWKIAFPSTINLELPARLDPDDSLLLSLPRNFRQVWFFVRFNQDDPALRNRDRAIESVLSHEYPKQNEEQFGDVRVVRYCAAQ